MSVGHNALLELLHSAEPLVERAPLEGLDLVDGTLPLHLGGMVLGVQVDDLLIQGGLGLFSLVCRAFELRFQLVDLVVGRVGCLDTESVSSGRSVMLLPVDLHVFVGVDVVSKTVQVVSACC